MKRPFRFSLLNLLLITTIIGLALAAYLTQSRLRLAEAELKTMRDQFGYLSVDDPTKVHMIPVPVAGQNHYRWRVHLPPGHDFRLYCYRGPLFWITGEDESKSSSVRGTELDPGDDRQVVIDALLEKTTSGHFTLTVSVDGQATSVGPIFGEAPPSWSYNVGLPVHLNLGKAGMVQEFDTSCPLVMLANFQGEWPTADSVFLWVGPTAEGESALKSAVDCLKRESP